MSFFQSSISNKFVTMGLQLAEQYNILETFRTCLTSSWVGGGAITNLALPFSFQNPYILDVTLCTSAQYVLVGFSLTLKLAYKLVNGSRNLSYISLVLVNPLNITIYSFPPSLFKPQYFPYPSFVSHVPYHL